MSTVIATDLDGPRGLAFGPDGSLYVAEAGTGGEASTVGRCPQIPPPIGPYSGGMTARISRIGPDGARSTLADGLPSTRASATGGGSAMGVADVAFLGGSLYALVAGAGCSHGLEATANGIYRIEPGREPALVADLGAWIREHPVAEPDPNDDEYDGTWYGMIAVGDALLAVEPNHGTVERVRADGRVERVVDLSASLGHIVPTAVTSGDGIYVANLGRMPIVPGSSRVLRVGDDGSVTEMAPGFTAVVGLAFAPVGTLYAVELSVPEAPGRPVPGTGRLVRVTPRGPEVVADGLTFPTGLAFGPDGTAYVSTFGLGPAGAGRIERFDVE